MNEEVSADEKPSLSSSVFIIGYERSARIEGGLRSAQAMYL